MPESDEEKDVLAGTAASYRRVAEEAMKLMSPDQLGQLRERLDELEAGDESDYGGGG